MFKRAGGVKLIGILVAGMLLAAGVGVGCTSNDDASGPVTSAAEKLGVARFVTEETQLATTVRGLDADGNEVGRMRLVHGAFTASPQFADDFDSSNVVGRQLELTAGGQRMAFEVAGFDPLMHMPAHPQGQWAIAAFASAPEVTVVLTRWGLGFEPGAALDGESAYEDSHNGFWYGHQPFQCSGTNCGTVFANGVNKTMNTCGGGAVAVNAYRSLEKHTCEGPPASNYTYDRYRIVQLCPPWTGGHGLYRWWAHKLCPINGNNTECGNTTSSTACKACAAYDQTWTYEWLYTTNQNTNHAGDQLYSVGAAGY